MGRTSTAHAKNTQPILPDAVYPLDAYHRDSGITRQRKRDAEKQGVKLKVMQVGRRKFVLGRDGIAFIQALAALGK